MNIFAFLILLFNFSSTIKAEQWCTKDMYDTYFLNRSKENRRVLVVWLPIPEGSRSNLTMCSKSRGYPIQRHCSHNLQRPTAKAKWTEIDKTEELLDCKLISNNCVSEIFVHLLYDANNNKDERFQTNYWLPGNLGEYSGTQELCLMENGLPLRRKCIYNSQRYTAQWENKTRGIRCKRPTNQHKATNNKDTSDEELPQQKRDPIKENHSLLEKKPIEQKVQENDHTNDTNSKQQTDPIEGTFSIKQKDPLQETDAIEEGDNIPKRNTTNKGKPKPKGNSIKKGRPKPKRNPIKKEKPIPKRDFIKETVSTPKGNITENRETIRKSDPIQETNSPQDNRIANKTLPEVVPTNNAVLRADIHESIFEGSTNTNQQWCAGDIYDTVFRTYSQEDFNVLVLWLSVAEGTYSNLTMCSNSTGQSIQRHCIHNFQSSTSNATWTQIDKNEKLLDCRLISQNCNSESFNHVFMSKNKVINNHTNSWLPAHLGEHSRAKDLCLLENGLPLTRKCIYNPLVHKAEWERRNMSNTICLRDTNQHIVTNDLDELYQEVQQQDRDPMQDNPKAINKLAEILSKGNTVRIAADLKISTSILKKITSSDMQPEMVPKILAATDLLLKSNESVVSTAMELGTPTQLIKTVDNYVDKMTNVVLLSSQCHINPSGVVKNIGKLVDIFYVNPLCSNISGIAFYNAENEDAKKNFGDSLFYDSGSIKFYRYLYLNQSLESIVQDDDIEAAVYLPEKVYNKIINDTNAKKNMDALTISLYRTPNFFIDETLNRTKAENIILKLSIPNFKDELPGYIPQIFQRPHRDDTEQPQCVSWDLRTWISSGFAQSIYENLLLCQTKSTTSFGAILGLQNNQNFATTTRVLTVMMDIAQDFVSLLGCCLSLIGLCCIWMTAMCCKRWRSESSNKFLLNICLVLTLLMSYFLFINLPDLRNRVVNVDILHHCVIEGAFLQYIILVLFLWMLFLAILQYQRYVTILPVRRPAHYRAKYILTAWSVPIIPTSLVILLDVKSYTPLGEGEAAICYPTGLSFYMTVLLPISLLSLANLAIFVYILYSLRNSLNKFHHMAEKKKIQKQVRLSILLFFLLGISWLFGILAHVDNSQVLSTLFCLTSTLQGFVLFVYFVVIDKTARHSWLGFCSGKDYYTLEKILTTTSTSNTMSSSKKT